MLADKESGESWVLIDDGEVARFGPALALCVQAGAHARVHLLVEESVPGTAGVISRRAAAFSNDIDVWSVHGRSLENVEPSDARPVAETDAPADIVHLLEEHGVEPVSEHGVLRGEVLGLEVARVVCGTLMVGVGRHDRDARSEMRPGEDPGAALDSAVEAVRRWRRGGVARHPANTLARARWLRSVVCSRPSTVGAVAMTPVAPPLPWFDLAEAGAAPCTGTDASGAELIAVCSTGVDLDLVPTAADSRLLYGSSPRTRLLLVVPEGDDVPVTRRLAGMLASPADVITVPRDWESLSGSP